MISFRHSGDFKKTEAFFKRASNIENLSGLERYALEGVAALALATPKKTGITASSWYYEIKRSNGQISIYWTNDNVNKGVNIAVILQYGHGTRNGGYVVGRDYINPAIRPVFDKIAESAWKEVTKS